jgi:hypothetical protein
MVKNNSIEVSKNLIGSEFTIYSYVGGKIYSGFILNENTNINNITIYNGIYLLNINNPTYNNTIKFFKYKSDN